MNELKRENALRCCGTKLFPEIGPRQTTTREAPAKNIQKPDVHDSKNERRRIKLP
jgi:hypothetical protein